MNSLNYREVVKKYDDIREQAGIFPKQIEEKLSDYISKSGRKIVVLDDDPTGVQAVHGICVYTDFKTETIREAFLAEEQMFFLLTNSRALTEEQTTVLHTEIAENIMQVSKETNIPFLLVSRGDSTLRGHYPLENEILRTVLEKEGASDFDGEIMAPFFAAGGRFTVDQIHYVKYGEELIPAAQTEFAGDKTFGYRNSDLSLYIEEKTNGCYPANKVTVISLDSLRKGEIKHIKAQLMRVENFGKVIVNALDQTDLNVFCIALYEAVAEGKTFLSRTAADFVRAIGGILEKPLLLQKEMLRNQTKNGGIIVIGSHTEKTTQQLECLKEIKELEYLLFNSDLVLTDDLDSEVSRIVKREEELISAGKSVVVFTKRELLTVEGDTKEQALIRSVKISEAVQRLVGDLTAEPAFVIAKGGITSSDIGVKALHVKRALVLGQAEPGIPVWQTDHESKFPGIPYIIFPGNVGEKDTLKKIVQTLLKRK